MFDFILRRISMFIQQLPRHQNESRRAVAALKRTAFDEGFLYGVELAIG
jgi:hypothetical protein